MKAYTRSKFCSYSSPNRLGSLCAASIRSRSADSFSDEVNQILPNDQLTCINSQEAEKLRRSANSAYNMLYLNQSSGERVCISRWTRLSIFSCAFVIAMLIAG